MLILPFVHLCQLFLDCAICAVLPFVPFMSAQKCAAINFNPSCRPLRFYPVLGFFQKQAGNRPPPPLFGPHVGRATVQGSAIESCQGIKQIHGTDMAWHLDGTQAKKHWHWEMTTTVQWTIIANLSSAQTWELYVAVIPWRLVSHFGSTVDACIRHWPPDLSCMLSGL